MIDPNGAKCLVRALAGFPGADGASGMVDAGRWHISMFGMPLCHACMHISMFRVSLCHASMQLPRRVAEGWKTWPVAECCNA